ncbi:MAG: ATP-binding cassette domain-containing protein [Candidatus Aminicenantes bacterium]|nr:ATP-binding cassette domain-containing protein [Candidatus Aminicenantes bacterium]NIM79436.1 ATP-binding cassette domain-containing protein [Candidatus Aminicenantes bacterium]NIN18718.1 ATP-binding cassette domain-containing protein [Candidatus Aminicenantes bacterium]NIN42642.1 ATP-binding cassette domain-containing protein [Candidatus Aminicenantes bacterium]NIN85381.1 ATP-binding cassette domain-containing protein [Candidatus Aminicenantes bacterium]
MGRFPFIKQLDAMDCGPTSLAMIARYYGKTYSQQTLRERCYITREGVSMLGTSDAAESIGMRTMGVRISFDKLANEVLLPCIAHWRQNHFIVVYKIKKDTVYVSDPAHGLVKYTKEEFLGGWASTRKDGEDQGLCLLLEPTPDFYKAEDESLNKSSFKFLFSYLRPYKKFLAQLFLGMGVGSLLQLIFPFLTQSIVDYGINNRDIGFITLILIAQLALFMGRTSVEFIRSWILLHISTRINISLISDFLIKLMKLPIGFFDTKMIGDIMQRIGDHRRIESFLTTSTLNILFSMINLVIFGIVLAIYDMRIFMIFLVGSILYIIWIYLFMKKRRELDFKRFAQLSDNQSNLFQIITGMQEIKLNNCEKQKRWEWERIQAKLFRVNIKSLSLSQYQQIGSIFINQTKNIFITFFAAKAVVTGEMTLGMMLAVQYIIGQLNSPIEQLIGFMHTTQDAKISLERLGEIHQKDDEEPVEKARVTILPESRTIKVKELSFQYEGPHSEFVLNNVDLDIAQSKVTAIVGMSGSGKTTLIKLLLGFYEPTKGEIKVGDIDIRNVNSRLWRQQIGVVMQDGYIFSDTIARNIAVRDEVVDKKRLLESARIANVQEFVDSLPLGYNTKIGQEGHGLSQGQKQRILIARAAYSNPEYLFFDEATNALDANNEKAIMENLEDFFKGRTVIVVAHRLSTVKNADQIVVLEKGKIVEMGTHKELTSLKGAYYNLVKNQLELGK